MRRTYQLYFDPFFSKSFASGTRARMRFHKSSMWSLIFAKLLKLANSTLPSGRGCQTFSLHVARSGGV